MPAPATRLRLPELWDELSIGGPVAELLPGQSPLYRTNWGAAYVTNSLPWLRDIPNESIDLVVTSPPYALEFKKEYGNVTKAKYSDWFKPFGVEIKRILKPEGSFVLNIGGSYNPGAP